MPLPITARRGIININTTTELPKRLPIYISGLFSINAFTPTMISVIEVKRPKIKKETKNEDERKWWAILFTELTASPEPIQRRTNAKANIERLLNTIIYITLDNSSNEGRVSLLIN